MKHSNVKLGLATIIVGAFFLLACNHSPERKYKIRNTDTRELAIISLDKLYTVGDTVYHIGEKDDQWLPLYPHWEIVAMETR